MTYDLGDTVTVTATVTPAADDTQGTLQLTAPDGSTVPATVVKGELVNDSCTLAAQVLVDQAGVWLAHWQISGTGAGVQNGILDVLPGWADQIPGSHATLKDYADFAHAAPPDDAVTMLLIASELVDDAISTSIYRVDADGNPSDDSVITAIREATCAQVQFWAAAGIKVLAGAAGDPGPVTMKRLATATLQYGTTPVAQTVSDRAAAPYALGDRAVRILQLANLGNQHIWMYG